MPENSQWGWGHLLSEADCTTPSQGGTYYLVITWYIGTLTTIYCLRQTVPILDSSFSFEIFHSISSCRIHRSQWESQRSLKTYSAILGLPILKEVPLCLMELSPRYVCTGLKPNSPTLPPCDAGRMPRRRRCQWNIIHLPCNAGGHQCKHRPLDALTDEDSILWNEMKGWGQWGNFWEGR